MMDDHLYQVVGGVLLGASATLSLLLLGKIAGISGIVWKSVSGPKGDRLWRWLFLSGLVIGSFSLHTMTGRPMPEPSSNVWLAIIGGLLVGFGVKVSNGCTSGHGLCGIGLLSKRSITATCTFMIAAIATVTVMRLAQGML